VLDIGCGTGNLLAHLQRTRGVTARGMEISGTACEVARKRGIEVTQADASQYDGPYPEVDYVVMSEVSEHLPNPETVLERVKDRFRKRLLVDVPNTGAINERLRLLMGRFPKQWVFHPGEHLRFWTVTDFLFMCRQLGLEVESYHGLYDPYYQLGIKLWRLYPRLFARFVLYSIKPGSTGP
jgi:methionine biosynthesis protein MetW